jgi:hypothetical protein
MHALNSEQAGHVERKPLKERPLFRKLEGTETAEGYLELEKCTYQRARKFWGVQKLNLLIPPTDSNNSRLDNLNAALRKYPDIDPELLSWRKKTTSSQAERLLDKRIKLPSKLELPEDIQNPAIAINLFDNSAINNLLMEKLSSHGDPAYVVIKAFESWRAEYHHTLDMVGVTSELDVAYLPELEHEFPILYDTSLQKVDTENLDRGYRAFEHFLFAVNTRGFLSDLKAVTVDYITLQQ